MFLIENFREITNEGSYYIVTIPFNKDCPLLKVNFDIDSETIEVDGQQYVVNDCLVSDNGEWIDLVCDRVRSHVEVERQRIGQRIAQVRNEHGMTQQQLSDAVGVSREHIARIEAGKYSVGLDILVKVAKALDMELEFVTKD